MGFQVQPDSRTHYHLFRQMSNPTEWNPLGTNDRSNRSSLMDSFQIPQNYSPVNCTGTTVCSALLRAVALSSSSIDHVRSHRHRGAGSQVASDFVQLALRPHTFDTLFKGSDRFRAAICSNPLRDMSSEKSAPSLLVNSAQQAISC